MYRAGSLQHKCPVTQSASYTMNMIGEDHMYYPGLGVGGVNATKTIVSPPDQVCEIKNLACS
jgi:hypothetical protein